jgi:topoisomerase-4 subunit A
MGESEQLLVMASDAGYGFVTKLEDLFGKNRAGKAVLSTPNGSKALTPKLISNIENHFLAVATNIGNLLIFPLSELPQLSKGKGNKLVSIPSSKVASREEYAVDIAILNKEQNLLIVGDGKPFKLKPADWENFLGARAQRGHKLPRGCRGVVKLKVESYWS